MRLERLSLLNFRKFERADLEFPDGVIGLVGRNGSGKSTIIEAIGWALYGHEAARTGKELLRRRGTAPGDDVRVILAFRYGGHSYEVTRELLGKAQAHSAKILVDGIVVVAPGANSGKEVSDYLERLFHMDRAAFFTSVVARQSELNALSDMRPAERRRVVLSMLRVDAVDEAIRLAREAKKDLQRRVSALASVLRDDAALGERERGLVARLEAEEARSRTLRVQADVASAAVDAARAEREAWQRRATEHAELRNRLTERMTRRGEKEREQERLRRELARIAGVEVELKEAAPRAAELPAARSDLEDLTRARERVIEGVRRRAEVDRAGVEVSRLERLLAEAERAAATAAPARSLLGRVREQLARDREARSALEGRIAVSRADGRRAEEELAGVRGRRERIERIGRESPCPSCTRPLREHYDPLVRELSAQERALGEAAERLAAERALLEAEREASGGSIAKLAEREAELSRKVEDLVRSEATRAELSQRVAADRARLADLQARVEEMGAPEPIPEERFAAARDRVRLLEGLAARVSKLQAEAGRRRDVEELISLLVDDLALEAEAAKSLEARIADLGFNAAAFERSVAQADATQRGLATARVALVEVGAAIERLRLDLATLRAEREENAARAREVSAMREEVVHLERLAGDREQGILVDFRSHLISRVRPALAAHAGDSFRDLTDGKYAGIELSEDYDLLVHDAGETFGLERFSGGEADLANLCLRLAIGSMIAERAGGTDFHFIVLDEVFGSQDEVRKSNVLRALAGLSGKFRQILLVTHIEDVRDAVERVFRVVERPDGASEVLLV